MAQGTGRTPSAQAGTKKGGKSNHIIFLTFVAPFCDFQPFVGLDEREEPSQLGRQRPRQRPPTSLRRRRNRVAGSGKKTFLSFAGGQLANFLTKQLAGIELGALIACSTGCS